MRKLRDIAAGIVISLVWLSMLASAPWRHRRKKPIHHNFE
jgi:hypothetical protein